MKKTSLLVVLLALFASAPPLVQSVYSIEKPKETKPENKPLSPDDLRELSRKIEWLQKNSREIDRRMFDLGSKQFEVSWTIWYSWYLLLAIILGILALILTLVGWLGSVWARGYVKEKVTKEIERMERETLAREFGIQGYFSWLHQQHDKAIDLSEDAIDLATEGSVDYWRVANNLAFFYAEKGTEVYRDRAIHLADKLKVARKPRKLSHSDELECFNTYAFVVSVYYKNFPKPMAIVKDTIQILRDVINDKEATESNKQNAQKHLGKLSGLLTLLPPDP